MTDNVKKFLEIVSEDNELAKNSRKLKLLNV